MVTAVVTALGTAGLNGGSQPLLPGFLNSLASPLEHYGVWAILLLVLVEDFGIPVPGETVLIAGAVFAGAGRLNIVLVGVVGFLAAVVGDNIGYAIGRFGGRALVERWGKYIFLTPERLDKTEAFFNRHGGKIITIARFVEGLRQANGLIAGITHMHWLRFVAFNALGAALWVGTWVSFGYFAGQHITTIYHYITTYSLYAAIAAVVLIAAWVAYRVRKHRRSGAAGNEVTATREATASYEATASHEATASQEATASREAAEREAVAPEAPARPEAAATPEVTAEPGTAADQEMTADQETTVRPDNVAGTENGTRDPAADNGQGLAERQDSERS